MNAASMKFSWKIHRVPSFTMPHPIRQIREERKMTQDEAAKKNQTTRAAWNRLEQKSVDEFSLGELSELANVFGLTLEKLLKRLEQLTEIKPVCVESKKNSSFEPQIISIKTRGSFFVVNPGKFFFSVIKGMCILFKGKTQHAFKTGESFCGILDKNHEIFNPHLIHEVQILLQPETTEAELLSSVAFSSLA